MYSPLIGQKLIPEENVVITLGATEAVFAAFTGHTSLGDEWIVIEPAYSIYLPMIKMARGVARVTSLKLVYFIQFYFSFLFIALIESKYMYNCLVEAKIM